MKFGRSVDNTCWTVCAIGRALYSDVRDRCLIVMYFHSLGYPIIRKNNGNERKVNKDLKDVVSLLRLTKTTNTSLLEDRGRGSSTRDFER
jgi:hypothetical protein